MAVVKCPSQREFRRRWYSEQERDDLKRRLAGDVHRMSMTLAETPMEGISKEDLLKCVGMESIMTQELRTMVHRRKREHVRAVLTVQSDQDSRDVVNEDEIARVSRRSSKWTRKRAQELADGYWTCLKEEVDEQESSPY